jgi:2-C-methyl-D-erythritol 2,4-cyclodiphosphate synthase
MTEIRVGSGFDAHKLVRGRRLVLGGLEIPFDLGLEGHSDGDCLLHAVCDAMLGAVAAGDLGTHFPSTDPQWKGASSLTFLERVARMVGEKGYAVENLDVTVIAERPALASYIEGMRLGLAQALGMGVDRVSVKAKTADGLGAIGAGQGIAAQAAVLLRRKG